jgi:hypothetical protein
LAIFSAQLPSASGQAAAEACGLSFAFSLLVSFFATPAAARSEGTAALLRPF